MANMYEINKIMRDCAEGEITPEETNIKLEEMGIVGIRYDENANVITADEMKQTSISGDLETVNGYIMLDTGTGYKNKVKVVNNVLMDCDVGNMYAIAIIGDLTWEVKGNKIVKFKGMRKN